MARSSHAPRDSAGRFALLGIRGHLNEGNQSMSKVIASEDVTVFDEALGINRKVVAGQPVPPDLVDAYQAKVGDAADSESAETASDEQTESEKPASRSRRRSAAKDDGES